MARGCRFHCRSCGSVRSGLTEVLRRELDRCSVGCAAGRVVLRLPVMGERLRVGRALCDHEALECGEPVVVVGLAGIGLATTLRRADLIGERRRPLSPAEQPRSLSAKAIANA